MDSYEISAAANNYSIIQVSTGSSLDISGGNRQRRPTKIDTTCYIDKIFVVIFAVQLDQDVAMLQYSAKQHLEAKTLIIKGCGKRNSPLSGSAFSDYSTHLGI